MLYYGNTITHPSTFCIIEYITSNHLVWIYSNVNNPLFCFTGLQQYKAFSLLYHGITAIQSVQSVVSREYINKTVLSFILRKHSSANRSICCFKEAQQYKSISMCYCYEFRNTNGIQSVLCIILRTKVGARGFSFCISKLH